MDKKTQLINGISESLQAAPRSKLLEVLIYLNKAEEKRLKNSSIRSES